MQQTLDVVHDLHFLLKEAALDGYTSMARWLGELEGSLASVSAPLPAYDVPFASALTHVQDILENLQESDPNLFWNMGQKDECLDLLKPFCRDTMKLNRKMARIATMLRENIRELEPTLIKFSNEDSYLERVPTGSSCLSLTCSTTQGSSAVITQRSGLPGARSAKSRKGVPTAIWKFITCRIRDQDEAQGGRTNQVPTTAKRQLPITHVKPVPKPLLLDSVKSPPTSTPLPEITDSIIIETAPGEVIPNILLPSESTLCEIPALDINEHVPNPVEDTEELEQKMIVAWSDQRMANWLEDNCIETGARPQPKSTEESLTQQTELFTQIVSNADSKWFPNSEDGSKLKPEENSNQVQAETNANQSESSKFNTSDDPSQCQDSEASETFPLDPFTFFKATVKELRSLVIRITFNLRLVERNFYAPPLQIMKSKRSDCRELRDYVAVVKEIGNEFEENQKATSPEEIELCQLLGTVYYQGLDCVKHFERFSSMIQGDAEFLYSVVNNYRRGESLEDDYELEFDDADTPLSDLEPKVRTKLQDLFQ